MPKMHEARDVVEAFEVPAKVQCTVTSHAPFVIGQAFDTGLGSAVARTRS